MFLNTARIPWAELRGEITSSDTALTAFNRESWPKTKAVKLNEAPLADANGVVLSFYGTDAADETAAYKLYGISRTNGPIQLLLEGVITLGTQVVGIDPLAPTSGSTIANGLWADTVTVTGGLFSSTDITQVLDSATNRIAMLKFDQTHIDELYLEVTLTTAATIYAIISGY